MRATLGGVEAGVESLPQPPRPRKRRLQETEKPSFMLACSAPPAAYSHWMLDTLADQIVKLDHVPALSGDTVGRLEYHFQSPRGRERASPKATFSQASRRSGN